MQKALMIEFGGFESELVHVRRLTDEEASRFRPEYRKQMHYTCGEERHKVESQEHGIYLRNLSSYKSINNRKPDGCCPGSNNSLYYLTDNQWDAILAEFNVQLAAKLDAIEQAKQKQQDIVADALAKAAATGKPVHLETWIADCDGSVVDCSFDAIDRYAMPDGTIKTTRTHTH